jgi:CO dehydrogenase/acetyl-CoA synthase alpha subunit
MARIGLLLQDRTPEDVTIAASPDHLRGYFFERFPRLLAVETGRRPTRHAVERALEKAGFEDVETQVLWEVRKNYADFDQLAHDLAARTGRSILHELSDAEVQDLIEYIRQKIPAGPIVEQDRWTLWLAAKPR